MKYASQALWWGIKEGFYQLGRLIVLNVTWVLFSLPVITLPAATLALAHSIRIMVVDETNYSWKIFLEGFKRYFLSSWRWFLPAILLPVIFIYNLLFFAVENYALSVGIQAANIVMLMIWFVLQTFTLPFLVEQEQPVMRVALLNGIRLLYQKPGMYWFTSIFLWVFLTFSIVLITPIFIVSNAFGLFIVMYCVQVYLGNRGMVPEEESSKVYKKPGSR
ncbi:MAG: hypothetical protein CVU40_15110 [Chloroflexi bacterium HGW-Chloroflexi-2]|jgi:uncharacterized membrane protein YesL|nr:MAG: hypothetical protein CVU40_15110 [Chloroflexi bacterium HGW-Chloroflexi-2]